MMFCRYCGKDAYNNHKKNILFSTSWYKVCIDNKFLPTIHDVCSVCMERILTHPTLSNVVGKRAYLQTELNSFLKISVENELCDLIQVTELKDDNPNEDFLKLQGVFYALGKDYKYDSKTFPIIYSYVYKKLSKAIFESNKALKQAIYENDIELLLMSLDKELIMKKAKQRGRFTQTEVAELCRVPISRSTKYMKERNESYSYIPFTRRMDLIMKNIRSI